MAERLPWQRVTEDGSSVGNAGQISAGNVAVKVPHADKESVLSVQKDESSAAHEVVGRLQKILTN